MKIHLSFLVCFSLLSSLFLLSSCQNQTDPFEEYTATSFCSSELSKTTSGLNRVCNANKIKTATGNYVSPFNTSIMQTVFAYKDLSLSKVYTIENTMGPMVANMHALMDRHHTYFLEDSIFLNNLHTINAAYGTDKAIAVEPVLYDTLKLAMEVTKQSDGKFNLFIGELSAFWDDLISYNASVEWPDRIDPSQATDEGNNLRLEIEQKKVCTPSPKDKDFDQLLVFDDATHSIQFKKYKTCERVSISLGGIGKGYFSETLAQNLLKKEIKNGFINAGGSSSIILGKNSAFSTWNIALSSPYSEFIDKVGTLEINQYSLLSTSGDSMNAVVIYDENLNPIIRHHIVNPLTGYPEEFYRKVTIYSNGLHGAIMDALSTILMNTPENEIETVLNHFRTIYATNIEAVFFTGRGNLAVQLHVTKGLKNILRINDKYPDPLEVTYYEF